MVWQSYSGSSQELSRSGEGGAKRLLLVFGICQKSTFGVITLADVVNPILYGLCWLSREQASNCQIEEANQEVVTQNDLLLVLLQSSLIRKKVVHYNHIIEQTFLLLNISYLLSMAL